ncbi:cell division protein FtsQ/DivIB [Suttonella sp. R2A3]|uniref:cell division protein FtsQ/DivIB n=1 Tax=Suttonella sp. R2A3 TaxID=2908648 RepID=UPI001F288116|nr:cell division protein FtsQ/DivIB [Suttonella sp. R2A3]UJF24617.1 cell division protein FtsQ/DivIB [Suttonella sp. R2A3]
MMVRRKHNKPRTSVSVPLQERTLGHLIAAVIEAGFILILVIALFVVGFFAYKRFTEEAFFPLQRLIIAEPLRYGETATIEDAVLAQGEKDLLHFDVNRLASEINALPWVKSASVEKRWPDAVYLNINERIPVVRWKNDYLDKDAVRFSLPYPPRDELLFMLSGPDGSEQKVLQRYREMEPWLLGQEIVPQDIRLDPRLIWHIGLAGDIDVIVGRDQLNNRLKKLAEVYQRIIKPYGQYVQTVDLRYQDGFSVRWKPGVVPKPQTDNNES